MSGRDHSCEACGRGGLNDPHDAEISRLKAEVERLTKDSASLRAELDRWLDWRGSVTSAIQNPGGAFYKDVPKLIAALVVDRDQARADLETERRRASQLSVENECLKADLAAAQKREDARKAWREKYAERCETRGGDVQGCGTWIHYRDVLDAIGRGEVPDNG